PTEAQLLTTDGDSSFTYNGDGLTITGSPGVAPPGTPVHITTGSAQRAGEHEGLEHVGTSVDITLGDGLQPQAPITVAEDIPDGVGDPDALIAVTEHEGQPEFVE